MRSAVMVCSVPSYELSVASPGGGKDSHGQRREPASHAHSQSRLPSPRLALSAELEHVPGRLFPRSAEHRIRRRPTAGREILSQPLPFALASLALGGRATDRPRRLLVRPSQVLPAGPHVSHGHTVRPALKKAARECGLVFLNRRPGHFSFRPRMPARLAIQLPPRFAASARMNAIASLPDRAERRSLSSSWR